MNLRLPISSILLLTTAIACGQKQMTPAQKLSNLVVPEIEFVDTPLQHAIEFLRGKSAELDPAKSGVNFVLTVDEEAKNAPVTLKLRNAPLSDAVRYVTELSRTSAKVDRLAVVVSARAPDATIPEKSSTSRMANRLTNKLRTLRLPQVEFSDTPLFIAVDFLAAKSLELDPAKQGINFILADGVNGDATVTLRLNDAPLSSVVGYVAELSGNRLRIDNRAVVILPPPTPANEKKP